MMLFIEIGTRYTPVVYYKRNRKKKKNMAPTMACSKKTFKHANNNTLLLKKQESEIKSVSFIILGFLFIFNSFLASHLGTEMAKYIHLILYIYVKY